MRTIVVIRHAHAGNHSAPDDHERPLDGRGRREAADAGRWLAAHWPASDRLAPHLLAASNQRLDVVLVSSAVRTRQTWELLLAELNDAPDATIEPRVYLGDLGDLLDLLGEHADAAAIAIVGHNPAVSALVSTLIDDGVMLSPAAIAIIEMDGEATPAQQGGSGRLIASWSPHRH